MQQISRQELDSESFEWSQIDYQLQTVTGKSSLKILNIYKFDDRTSQSLDYKSTHTAMVNVTDFSKEYSQRLLNKSLSIEDVVFKCGHIDIQKYLGQSHKLFTFLICKIHLGRIGQSSESDVTQCDSILIEPETQDEVFQFNYLLRTPGQYSVQYEVSFTSTDEKEFKLTDYECSNCENRIPSIYCRTQNLFFCDSCCAEHHKSKLMSTHGLEPVNKVNTLPSCKNHNKKLEYYCLKCSKYLCSQCTQKGVHHQNHEHPYQLIANLYEEKSQNSQRVSKRPKEKLDGLSFNLNVKKKQIEENYLQVKQEVTRKYQTAMEFLDQIYFQKLQTLNSCALEIQMMMEKIQWSKTFINFEEKNLKPIYYFESQKKFEQQLSKLKISDFESIFSVKPDIKLEGDLTLGTSDDMEIYRKKNAKSSANDEKQAGIVDTTRQFKYVPNREKPKLGDLSLMIQNSGLKFFQVHTEK